MDSNLILNRLMEYNGYHKDKELYEFLGVKSSTFGSWRSRNTLDYELIMRKFPEVDYNWLFKGEEITNYANNNESVELKQEIKQCRDQLNKTLDIIATLSKQIENTKISI